MSTAVAQAIAALRKALGDGRVDTDPVKVERAGQDVFHTGGAVAAVIRPAKVDDIPVVLEMARQHHLAVVPRGAGLGYTRSVLSGEPERALVLDMRAMNAIREINAADMYVVVEPGCTWQILGEAVGQHGLEPLWRGPVSGRLATVGGAIGHNAVFYGSGLFGTVADTVIGLEVVTGKGEILRTGSWAIETASPFLRHFGPDMTGLFTGDCGALGIKTAIVLRLRKRPRVRQAISWQSGDMEQVFAFFRQASHLGTASQIIGLDVVLQQERIGQASWREKGRQVLSLLSGQGGLRQRLRQAGAMLTTALSQWGPVPQAGRGYAIHAFLEGDDTADCDRAALPYAALARELGLAPANSAVADAMVRLPFGPVTGLAGNRGERWVPVHFIMPHSLAQGAFDAIRAVHDEFAERLLVHGIKMRNLLANLGAGAVTIEPMFLWPDRLTDHARLTLIEQGGYADADAAANVDAEQLVSQVRKTMIDRLDAMGAVHTQLGRQYSYLPRLSAASGQLARDLKSLLDPDGLLNPGVLGLGT